jgi:hypothetical protein
MSLEALVAENDADELELEQQPETTETTETTTTTEPTELQTALAELTKTQKTILERTAPAEKVAELTPEQKKEFWAVYDPESSDKEFFKKFFRMNPDATSEEIAGVKGLFAAVQEGLVKQSIKGSRNYFDHALEQLKQEYAPLREFVDQVRAEKTRERFFSEYKTLNEPKFEKIIQITARSLAEKTFDDEKSYFKALAEGVAETIKGVNPDFDLGKQQQPAGKAPKLPRTSVGGGGGAGRGTAKVESTDDSADIFED